MKTVKIIDCVKFDRIGGYAIKAKIIDEKEPIYFSFLIQDNMILPEFIEDFEKLIKNLKTHV